MYSVLLVDDERTILEGIAQVVDWQSAGTVLAGTARNGLEAWDRIVADPPDIVISDIRMPGMDGIQLAANVSRDYPQTRIILLSGYGEFAYAQSAMQYGVKHYLLKPCNETAITEALKEAAAELDQSHENERFVAGMKERLQKMLPHVKEQFLKEFVTNKTYGSRDWDYYRQLFGLEHGDWTVRLLLFELERPFEFEHLFAVKNIAEDILGHTLLSSTVGDRVLIVVPDTLPLQQLHDRIAVIRETFLRYYKIDATAALSEAGPFTNARRLYNETLDILPYRYYLGEGSLITKRDVEQADTAGTEVALEDDRLLQHIRTGRWEEADAEIEQLFHQLSDARVGIPVAKSFVAQWFMSMIRLGPAEAMNRHMDRFVALMQAATLFAVQTMFRETARELTQLHYETNVTKHSAIIGKVIAIIDSHLGDPELSLGGVANQMLYMNSDYLGKLFKKETGEKFSNYVMKVRIAKAKEALERSSDIKIFELAEALGFGDNPQYFSQVFKKHVGCTPSEYGRGGQQSVF